MLLRSTFTALVAISALLLAGCATQMGDSAADTTPDSGAACGLDAQRRARAEAVLQQIVQRGHAPGVAADIRCNGQPWLVLAAGQRAAAGSEAMRSDDLFRIYSMTKPVTALAVMLLVEDGRVALDDPLARHLPAFASTPVHVEEKEGRWITAAPARALTVRDVLRHTAGMPYLANVPHPVLRRYVERGIDNGSGLVIKPTDGSAPVASAAELAARIASIPLLTQPGARFIYGNASDVAGALVEAVSGASLGSFLQQRLFAPLGMHETMWVVPAAQASRLPVAYSAPTQRPRTPGDVLATPLKSAADVGPSALTAADPTAGPGATSVYTRVRPIQFGGAGLVSTAADYQRFMTLLVQGGTWQGQRIVRAETIAEMTKNQLSAEAREGSGYAARGLGYGLGLGLVTDASKIPYAVPARAWFWAGAASTYFWIDPDRRIGGVLMTQVFGGDVAPYFSELMDVLYRP